MNSSSTGNCRVAAVGRQGSMITETAVFLPVFILAVLTLSFLIKGMWIQVSVFEALTDEAKKMSVKAYVFENTAGPLPEQLNGFAADAANRQVFLHSVRSGLKERGLNGAPLFVKTYETYGTSSKEDPVIRAEIVYPLDLNLPADISEIRLNNVVCWRIWKGMDLSGDLFSFERMAQAEHGDIVYIFPNAGSRFHQRSCRYVNSYAEQTKVTGSLLQKYDACPLCIEDEASIGESVYIFRYGNSYHRSSCKSVKKYVIPMDREDAADKHYAACSVCGG